MQCLALLRGVMPTGPNRIPKMSELVEILEASGLRSVSTYIQSGNILCETDLSAEALANQIHQIILQQIVANLSVVIKKKADLD